MNQVLKVNHPQVVCETIDGEVVIIHLETGCYYSLTHTGAAIWRMVELQTDSKTLIQEITQAYNGSPEEISVQIFEFLDHLQHEDLIRFDPGTTESTASPPAIQPLQASAEKPHFEPPRLEKFSDMEDLLLLDPIHEVDVEAGWPSTKS
jgi:hypothetical protein